MTNCHIIYPSSLLISFVYLHLNIKQSKLKFQEEKMESFIGINYLIIMSIYFYTGSGDEYAVPFIITLFSLLTFSVIFCIAAIRHAKNRQYKDKHKSLQNIHNAKIVEKKTNDYVYAPTEYIVEFENGNRILLKAYKDNLKKLVVGDVVNLYYRGETMEDYDQSKGDIENNENNEN